MADPVTIGAMAATAAGGIISGLGAKESGDAQAGMYQYKAGVALINKQVADQNAAWAMQSGGAQAEVKGLQEGQKIGMEKVTQAASGFDVNTGTAARVRKDMSDVAGYDQAVIRWDAAKAAYGYEIQGATDTAESRLDTMASDQARTAGTIGEIGSFINAGASVASKWSQAKSIGMLG